MNTQNRRKVLFLCTGNSVRSQIAEAFLKNLAGDRFEVQSAGTEPAGVNPRTIEVMNEVGIDISAQSSDRLERHMLKEADILITLCGDARDNCPIIPPGAEKRHWALEDPSFGGGSEVEIMNRFRKTRDLIKKYVEDLAAE